MVSSVNNVLFETATDGPQPTHLIDARYRSLGHWRAVYLTMNELHVVKHLSYEIPPVLQDRQLYFIE